MLLQAEIVVFRGSKMAGSSGEGIPLALFGISNQLDLLGLVETPSIQLYRVVTHITV